MLPQGPSKQRNRGRGGRGRGAWGARRGSETAAVREADYYCFCSCCTNRESGILVSIDKRSPISGGGGKDGRVSSSRNTQRLHEQRVFHHTGGRPWTIYRCSSRAAPGSIPGRGTAKSTVRRDGAGVGGAGARGTQITVVSYNVLADSLVSFDYIPYCKSWNDAAWKARPGRTLDKVLQFQPDVVCLQEVDEDRYTGVYKASLEALGYKGAYCKRSGDKKDGCATFVLGHHLRLVEQEDVIYKIDGHPVLDRDNIALLAVVDVILPSPPAPREESVAGGRGRSAKPTEQNRPTPEKARKEKETGPRSASNAEAAKCGDSEPVAPNPPAGSEDSDPPACARVEERARLVIANTHLLFNPKRGDIKTAQLMMLTDRVERLTESSGADGVIICGDFNMVPDSALYHYMVQGELDVDGLNRFDMSGQCGLVTNSRHDQRMEPSNCGVMPHRVPGTKHQGGGCSLGSFLRPLKAMAGGRGRGRGGKRGRGGRGGRESACQSPPCEACSSRSPHGATSTYVSTHAGSVGMDAPPGAPHGALFAVMDPTACPCTSVGVSGRDVAESEGDGSDTTKENTDGGSASRGVDDKTGRTGEPQPPPVLWPTNGGKRAQVRNKGPVAHRLRLRSAYAQQGDAWGTGEPAFTSYHHMFKGTVDYIFYGPGPPGKQPGIASGKSEESLDASATNSRVPAASRKGRLRCVGVAEPPLRSDIGRFGGLPSPEEPSDHVMLVARFEVMLP